MTSSTGVWLSNYDEDVKMPDFLEKLMATAWVIMPPDVCLAEIEKTMAATGSTDRFYTFKTLTPLYPTMVDKLTDPDYWTKFEWTHEKALEQE